MARENDSHEHSGWVLLGSSLRVLGVWWNWSTRRCPYWGTGLLSFACMREHVYYYFPVCRNMSTRNLSVCRNLSTRFYPFEGTCLRLFACMRELVCKYPLPCLAKCTCRQKEDFATEESILYHNLKTSLPKLNISPLCAGLNGPSKSQITI